MQEQAGVFICGFVLFKNGSLAYGKGKARETEKRSVELPGVGNGQGKGLIVKQGNFEWLCNYSICCDGYTSEHVCPNSQNCTLKRMNVTVWKLYLKKRVDAV